MILLTLVEGDAGPEQRYRMKQNGSYVDLSGDGVAASFVMKAVGSTSTFTSITCTGLDSDGYVYVPITTTACGTAGEYTARVKITGLGGGTQSSDRIKVVVEEA